MGGSHLQFLTGRYGEISTAESAFCSACGGGGGKGAGRGGKLGSVERLGRRLPQQRIIQAWMKVTAQTHSGDRWFSEDLIAQ